MKRETVRSSNIHSIGYDSAARVLEVEFHKGSIYQYFGVPKNVHSAFMRASSHGRYFIKNIREKYVFKRIK